jgi:monothiol glutaredoxin
MKGTPLFPQCGFSSKAIAILDHLGVEYASVDVLQDMEVRQGIKEFSDWPTIPQLYVKGEFVGGSDIMMEMFQDGELRSFCRIRAFPRSNAVSPIRSGVCAADVKLSDRSFYIGWQSNERGSISGWAAFFLADVVGAGAPGRGGTLGRPGRVPPSRRLFSGHLSISTTRASFQMPLKMEVLARCAASHFAPLSRFPTPPGKGAAWQAAVARA